MLRVTNFSGSKGGDFMDVKLTLKIKKSLLKKQKNMQPNRENHFLK